MTAEMSNNSSDAEIRSTEHSVLATRFAHQNRVNCQTELCRFPRIFEELVGASGFEPPTPRSRTECSTRLSHAPTRRYDAGLKACTTRETLSYHRPRKPGTSGTPRTSRTLEPRELSELLSLVRPDQPRLLD